MTYAYTHPTIRRTASAVPWIALAILLTVTAQAAELTTVQHDKSVTIRISGEIAEDDFDKFSAIAAHYPKAQVDLSGPGGSIEDALQIGEMIHQKGYTTIVGSGSTCASACGYIWLGGTTRTVAGNGEVGFHAAYLPQTNNAVSSTGNALVGAYLARLGFSDMAIIYATKAAPNDIRWLTPTDAVFLEISVVWDATTEKLTPATTALVTRAQVEEALLRQNVMVQVKANYRLVYEQLVSDVLDAQLKGKSWTSALLVGYDRMRFPDQIQKNIETALLTVRPADFVDTILVRYITYAQQTDPAKCASLFDNGGAYFDELLHQSPDNLKAEFVELLGAAIETTLDGKLPPIQKPTAKDRRYLDRQMIAIAGRYLRTLPQLERKRLIKASKRKDFRIDCRFAVFIFQEIKSDPRMLKTIFFAQFK